MIGRKVESAANAVTATAHILDGLAGWARDNERDRGLIRRSLALNYPDSLREALARFDAARANLVQAISGEGKVMEDKDLLTCLPHDSLTVRFDNGRMAIRTIAKVGKIHVTDSEGTKWNRHGHKVPREASAWHFDHAWATKPGDVEVVQRQRAIRSITSRMGLLLERAALDQLADHQLGPLDAALIIACGYLRRPDNGDRS